MKVEFIIENVNESIKKAEAGHHKSNARKEWSAKAAMVPEELGLWVGQCFYPREGN